MAKRKAKSILCFGNPLIDSYLLATEEMLEKYGIKKGELALYDSPLPPDHIKRMMEEYDFTPFEAGGSSINTIKAYAILGGESAVCCSYGADERGQLAANEFNRLGIKNYGAVNKDHPTSYLMIFVTPDANRTVVGNFYESYHLDSSKVDYSIVNDYDYIFVESYSFSDNPKHDSVYKTLEHVEKYGKKMIFALSNPNCLVNYMDSIVKFAFHKCCKVVIGNASEFLGLFPEAKTVKDVVDRMVEYNRENKQWELVLITDGPDGAHVIMGDEAKFIKAPDVAKVVDTTGAGDYFAAGFLFALLNGYGFEAATVLSQMLSGDIISKIGVRLSDDIIEKANGYIDSIS